MKMYERVILKAVALTVFSLTLLIPLQTAYASVFNIADGDVPGLIAAINASNANVGPDTINLAQGGTYTLTQFADTDGFWGPRGLPTITSPLTINGNGATIKRSSAVGTPDFRILFIFVSSITLDSVTIRGGRTAFDGGGIHMTDSTAVIRNSTITGNSGSWTGGVAAQCSTLSIENSTVSQNSGVGIGSACGTTSISNSTVFENAVGDPYGPPGSGAIRVKNSILYSPTLGYSCAAAPGAVVSLGHNIVGDNTCGFNGPGDMQYTDPLLAPLANNGGNTATRALLAGSPAIDAIPLADCTDTAGVPVTADQRGVFRPQGARCDIGSYELIPTAGPGGYNDRQSFLAAVCPAATVKTIDFSSKDDATPITNPAADTYFETLTLSGVTFHQVQAYFNQLIYYFPTAVIKADLPPNTFSLGTDLFPGYGAAGTFTITLSTGETYHINTNGTSRFFGVVSSTPIEWVSFSFDNNYLIIDNFTLATGCDSTPPVITPTVTGTLGNNGWYTGDVQVSWSVTDPDSSVASSTGCDNTSLTADTAGITFTCSATSGGGSTSESVTVKRDATAPSITCGSADGVWRALDVSIACTASDNFSQLASAGDANFSLVTNIAPGSETANAATSSRTVCDQAGNCSSAGPINGNKVDRKAPTITITSPTGTVYLLNQAVAAGYSCQDGGSGIAACNGTASNGGNIDTASAGSKIFTVSAVDNAGNAATPQSVSYTVGFGVAVPYDQTKAVKSGSTIPIKIQLVDALGHNVSEAGLVVHAASLIQIATSAGEAINDAGSSNPDADFRFDSSLGGYIFNLKTTGFPTGTYRLGFTVNGDPVTYTVQFAVRQ